MTSNPFRDIRVSQDLSQQALADKVGVSKHAILRLEQGMYPDPLPRVVNYFTENFPVSQDFLLSKYEEYQVGVRVENKHVFGSPERLARRLSGYATLLSSAKRATERREHDSAMPEHPLVYLRSFKELNTTALAKCLCVSQTVVSYFESKPVSQQSVPVQLLAALIDNGYSNEDLELFCRAYDDYRELYLKRKKAGLSVRIRRDSYGAPNGIR